MDQGASDNFRNCHVTFSCNVVRQHIIKLLQNLDQLLLSNIGPYSVILVLVLQTVSKQDGIDSDIWNCKEIITQTSQK